MLNKVIISGGGTGGHIFPAVAIAQEIQRQNPKAQILFVGAEGRMEMEKIPALGYEIVGLPIAGIQRKLDWKNLMLPFKLLRSLWKARSVIGRFRPDAVIGVGGYASGPTLRVAQSMGIPTFIQEQNSFAGVTNKLLAKGAKQIFVAYPNMERFFPKEKIVLTGNPIRFVWDENRYPKEEARRHFGLHPDRKTILMIGGSLGARAMNQAMEKNLEEMLSSDVQVIWQTGKNYIPQEKWKENENVWVGPFITEMHQAYAAADFIISRAGAMSISELSWVAKPTLFIPSPYVAEDHQTHNAMALVNDAAALLIKEKDIDEQWMKVIHEVLQGKVNTQEMCSRLSHWAKPHAAKDIVFEINNSI
jgi:UDP-N-acetylglucosamine--N-acetylmuramyl-(pentapeptide) pyrophosphoryl-undecaprenol N-acetylglucosamine transferase